MSAPQKVRSFDQTISVVPKKELKLINAKLESELFEMAVKWNSAKRFKVAQTLMRWAGQLTITGGELQMAENKHLARKVILN